MGQDLTTLDLVKSWLGISPLAPTQDVMLGRLIKAASAFVLNQCNRSSIGAGPITRVLDGYGKDMIILPDWPVRSVASIAFGNHVVSTAATTFPRKEGTFWLETPPAAGALQRLQVFGFGFPEAPGSIQVSYVAGFWTDDEAVVIPEDDPWQIGAGDLEEVWTGDLGVTFADGSALTKILAGTPASGSYLVDSAGTYTFAAADAGKTVLISYGSVPDDLVQVVTELVGERFKTKDRIGLNSQSLAGKESVTYYSTKDMSSFASSTLQPYKSVLPI